MGGNRITQIPIAGGSGRVPTGAMQFCDDWPGLFIRGDDVIGQAQAIRSLAERLAGSDDPVVSLALYRLGQIADIVERDVISQQTDC